MHRSRTTAVLSNLAALSINVVFIRKMSSYIHLTKHTPKSLDPPQNNNFCPSVNPYLTVAKNAVRFSSELTPCIAANLLFSAAISLLFGPS